MKFDTIYLPRWKSNYKIAAGETGVGKEFTLISNVERLDPEQILDLRAINQKQY